MRTERCHQDEESKPVISDAKQLMEYVKEQRARHNRELAKIKRLEKMNKLKPTLPRRELNIAWM